MIKAHHNNLIDRIFQPYVTWLLRKNFYLISLFGDITALPDDRPLLLLPNHSSWWDGFFIYLLNKKVLKRDAYLMMLEDQLEHNRFFARLGAYSIDPANFSGLRQSLNFTIEILERYPKHALVCIFPQGLLQPWSKRPLEYRKGIDWIVKRTQHPMTIIQLAIKAEFMLEQRPEVFLKFGNPIYTDTQKSIEIDELEKKHEKLLMRLQRQINKKEKGKIILKGADSVNSKFERFRNRLQLK